MPFATQPHHVTLTNHFVTSMGKKCLKQTSAASPLTAQPMQPGSLGWDGGEIKTFLSCPGEHALWLSTHGCLDMHKWRHATIVPMNQWQRQQGTALPMPPGLGLPGVLAQHTAAPLNPSSPKADPIDPRSHSSTQTWKRGRVPGAGAWEDACLELAQKARQCLDLSPLHGRPPWK